MNKLWFISVFSILTLIFIGVIGHTAYNLDIANSKTNSINVTDISSTIKSYDEYYTGSILGTFKTSKEFNQVSIEIDFYDDSGMKISSNALTEDKIVSGQNYDFDASYSEKTKPIKAVIHVYSVDKQIYTANLTL